MKIDKLPRFNMSAFSSGDFDYEGPCVLVDSNGREWLLPNNPTPSQLDQAEEKAMCEAVDSAMINWNFDTTDIPDIHTDLSGKLYDDYFFGDSEKSATVSMRYSDIKINDDGAAFAKPSWSGEGLPPVGCECEISNCGNDWVKAKVLYMGTSMCVVDHGYGDQHYHIDSVKFRPIKPAWLKEHEKDRELSLAWAYIINNSEHTIHSIKQMEDEYVIDLANRMREEDDRN